MQRLSPNQLNPSTVKEVSLSCLDDNLTLQVCAGQRINLRILLVLSGPISDVQVYLGVRGTARGIKTDFNTEGAGYSKKLATSNQLIFDGTEPGTGGILHGGTHGFDVTLDIDDIKEEGIEYLPSSYRCEDDGMLIYVKYLMKVLVVWPGPLNSKLKKDCIQEIFIKDSPKQFALWLSNPDPYLFSNGQSALSKPVDRRRKPVHHSHEIEWNFAFSRQSVIPGDILKCFFVFRTSILSQVTHVRVALLQRTRYKSGKFGYMEYLDGTRLLEKTKFMGKEDGMSLQKLVDFTLTVPTDASPTMRLETMSHDVYVICEVLLKDRSQYMRLIEAPLRITSHKPLNLERVESVLSEQFVSTMDYPTEPSKSSMIVVYSFNPSKDDEILLELGDLCDILQSFDDGWSLVFNHTKFKKGIVPTFSLSYPLVLPTLPDEDRLISKYMQNIIGDLRTLCKMEERYSLHLDSLIRVGDSDEITFPELAYLLHPKSRITRILKHGVEECSSCLAHEGVL